jgi:hypothetical protein
MILVGVRLYRFTQEITSMLATGNSNSPLAELMKGLIMQIRVRFSDHFRVV